MRVCSVNSVTEARSLSSFPDYPENIGIQSFLCMCSNFRYDEEKLSWLKEKRTRLYNNPCETETRGVKTSTLDTNSCADCTYYPSTLTEVKCSTSNVLSGREKASCKFFSNGDCIDIQAVINVLKVFPSFHTLNTDVILKVGCSCKAIAGL